MKLAPLLTLVLATVSFACAKGVPEADLPPDHVYNASKKDVWDAALATLAEREIVVAEQNETAGSIQTETRRFAGGQQVGTYLYCGEGDLGPITAQVGFRGSYSLSAQISEMSGGTSLGLRAAMFGQITSRQFNCYSLGALEGEILDDIDNRLSGAVSR